MKVGIVALQGAFARHAEAVAAVGAEAILVRTPEALEAADVVVLPGGESTTMSMLLESSGLFESLAERIAGGTPVLGTCAGMILLAAEVLDGRPDQRTFCAVDIDVRRNAYGRQVDSFEAPVDVAGLDGPPFGAVFIRAPAVERTGPGVEVVARAGGRPVACRQGAVVVTAFHPELTDDRRVHAWFVRLSGEV